MLPAYPDRADDTEAEHMHGNHDDQRERGEDNNPVWCHWHGVTLRVHDFAALIELLIRPLVLFSAPVI
jgi:hypothetical protein